MTFEYEKTEPTFEKGTLIYTSSWSTLLFPSFKLFKAHYEAVVMHFNAFENIDREKGLKTMMSIQSQIRTYVYRLAPVMVLDTHERYYTVLVGENIGLVDKMKKWHPYTGKTEAEEPCLIEIEK